MLYPLTFDYVTKDYIWGGQRLCRYARPLPESQRLAESWEISTHPNGPSRVKNGPEAGRFLSELVSEYGAEILGTEAKSSEFPFLIKLIDAASNLSIQVHPDDEVAAKLDPPSLGKNELWYVLDRRSQRCWRPGRLPTD